MSQNLFENWGVTKANRWSSRQQKVVMESVLGKHKDISFRAQHLAQQWQVTLQH